MKRLIKIKDSLKDNVYNKGLSAVDIIRFIEALEDEIGNEQLKRRDMILEAYSTGWQNGFTAEVYKGLTVTSEQYYNTKFENDNPR